MLILVLRKTILLAKKAIAQGVVALKAKVLN
jgi:hypothetical protein